MDLSPNTWATVYSFISAIPRAHEDDAERAVRVGLGIIDSIGRLDVKSAKLQARVGIATGLVSAPGRTDVTWSASTTRMTASWATRPAAGGDHEGLKWVD